MTVATRTGLTLEAAAESFRRARRIELAEQTLDRVYMPRLNAFAAWVRAHGMPPTVTGLTREHVAMYIEHLQTEAPGRDGAGQKSATVSISYRTLRTFFNWLVAEDELRRSPMARMKPPRVTEEAPKVLSDIELARLFKACGGRSFDDRRDHALMRVLADSGMRRGELAGLTVGDVHLDGAGLILLRGETQQGEQGPAHPAQCSGRGCAGPLPACSVQPPPCGAPLALAREAWTAVRLWHSPGGREAWAAGGCDRAPPAPLPAHLRAPRSARRHVRLVPDGDRRVEGPSHAGSLWTVSRCGAGRLGVPTGV